MIPLLRYHSALLLRSHRWLPPVLLYAAFLAVGVQPGGPVLDSYGFAAIGPLPLAAWLCRLCVTGEPPAARACAAAATGPGRAHLARVLTGALSATVLALVGTVYVALGSDPHASDHHTAVPVAPAFCAGLLAALVSVLLGTAVGALCNWPVLRSAGWSVPVRPVGRAPAAGRERLARQRRGIRPGHRLRPRDGRPALAAAARHGRHRGRGHRRGLPPRFAPQLRTRLSPPRARSPRTSSPAYSS